MAATIPGKREGRAYEYEEEDHVRNRRSVLVLLAILVGMVFGSDEPHRVTISLIDLGGGEMYYREQTQGGFALVRAPFFTHKIVELAQREGVDVVVRGEFTFGDQRYQDGDRLTSKNGRLVKQTWYQTVRNDVQYWAYLVRRKITGKD